MKLPKLMFILALCLTLGVLFQNCKGVEDSQVPSKESSNGTVIKPIFDAETLVFNLNFPRTSESFDNSFEPQRVADLADLVSVRWRPNSNPDRVNLVFAPEVFASHSECVLPDDIQQDLELLVREGQVCKFVWPINEDPKVCTMEYKLPVLEIEFINDGLVNNPALSLYQSQWQCAESYQKICDPGHEQIMFGLSTRFGDLPLSNCR